MKKSVQIYCPISCCLCRGSAYCPVSCCLCRGSVKRCEILHQNHFNKLLRVCKYFTVFMNAFICIKKRTPTLKFDLSKNIASKYQCQLQKLVNIKYILSKPLFYLKVGQEIHRQELLQEKTVETQHLFPLCSSMPFFS